MYSLRFLSEIPANQIDSTVTTSANIIVQGAVDLCFEEDDGVVVLDFKTDRVDEESIQAVAEQYRPQVETYARALSRIYELPIKAKALYFFCLDTFVWL